RQAHAGTAIAMRATEDARIPCFWGRRSRRGNRKTGRLEMTQCCFVTRRSVLGALVTIPGAASVIGCIASTDEADEEQDILSEDGLTSYPTLDLKQDC